jgi:hypothetical protein
MYRLRDMFNLAKLVSKHFKVKIKLDLVRITLGEELYDVVS